jgi:AcrR family transcriptional regulator
LSRDAIVAEALRQVASGSDEGMSLRKVAVALETGPATLYAYVEDLDELRALVLDRALERVALGGSRGTWRERLNAVLESYVRVLSASVGLARLAFGTVAVGPNALRIVEKLLALLEEAGVPAATRAWAIDLLLLYVTATAAEHAGTGHPAAPEGPVAKALECVSEKDFPRIHAARDDLLSGSGDERFSWALDVLVKGILDVGQERRARATRRSARSRSHR